MPGQFHVSGVSGFALRDHAKLLHVVSNGLSNNSERDAVSRIAITMEDHADKVEEMRGKLATLLHPHPEATIKP